MKNYIIILTVLGAVFYIMKSVYSVEEGKLIRKNQIAYYGNADKEKVKTIYYEIYSIGEGRYRFYFYLTEGQSTTELFQTVLEGDYGKKLQPSIFNKKDNLIIIHLDHGAVGNDSKKVNGITYELEGEYDSFWR